MTSKRKSIATYARETELILAALGESLDGAQAERLASLVRQELNWDFILATATVQRIRPALFWALNKICPRDVPPAVLDQLQIAYRKIASYNLALMKSNLQLLDLFKARGIPVIPLKGPAQATALYGNLALREICDLDFLVRRQDLPAAREMFIEQGYHSLVPLPPDWDQDLDFKNGCYEYSMRRDDGRINIELHWHILPLHSAFGMDEDYLWQQAVPTVMGGRNVLTFPPEVAFLFACIHNEKHNWIYVRFLSDALRMLVKYPDLDWAWILGEAGRFRQTEAVLITVYLASRYWGIPLPPLIQSRIAVSPGILRRAALARARLFQDEFLLPTYSEWKMCLAQVEGSPVLPDSWLEAFQKWFAYMRVMLTPEYPDRQRLRWIPTHWASIHYLVRLSRFTRDMIYTPVL